MVNSTQNQKSLNTVDINKFLQVIKLKKQFLQKLKNKANLLDKLIKEKNYKNLNLTILNKKIYKRFPIIKDFLVSYIIDFTFSRTNTLMHVMDFSGDLKFFCSAGSLLKYKGKRKLKRYAVIKKMCNFLISKLRYLRKCPVALNLKNAEDLRFFICKILKKKLFIKVVKIYNLYPHNGCRKKKVKRKKVRMKKKKNTLIFNTKKK